MKRHFQFILFLLLISSCGSNNNSSQSEDIVNNSGKDKLQLKLNFSHPDSLINSYKNIRNATSENHEEFDISAKNYFQKEGFFMVNFIESWSFDNREFSVVIGAKNKTDELADDQDEYKEISDLFESYSEESYSIYRGNFEEAPDYNIGGFPLFKNVSCFEKMSLIDCKKRLFALNKSDLIELTPMAYTKGEEGICEDIIGYRETFKLADDPKDVLIEVVEIKYKNMNDCQVESKIEYSKLIDDYWENKNYASPIFITDVINSPAYKEIDTLTFYPVKEVDGDSLITHEVVSFSEYNVMDDKIGVYMSTQTSDAFVSSHLFEVSKIEDGSYYMFIYEAMLSAEVYERVELNRVHIEKNKSNKDMYKFTYLNGDVKWYTTNKNKYPYQEIAG